MLFTCKEKSRLCHIAVQPEEIFIFFSFFFDFLGFILKNHPDPRPVDMKYHPLHPSYRSH